MSKEIKLLSCEIKIGRKKFKLVENYGGCKGCFFDYGDDERNEHCPRGEYQEPICTVFNATSVWKEIKNEKRIDKHRLHNSRQKEIRTNG